MNHKELVKIDKSTLSKPIRSHLDIDISNSHLLHANVSHNGKWDGEAQCQSPN